MEIGELISRYRAHNTAVADRQAAIDAKIAALQEERDRLRSVSYMEFARVLAGEIADLMPDRTVEVLGPFGLGRQVGIHVRRGEETVASLTLQPDEDNAPGAMLVDLTSSTPYAPRTIGQMNGLGHRFTPLAGTFSDLVETLRLQEREHDARDSGGAK